MQRKAYVPGVVALLAALVAGCTSSSGDEDVEDSKPGGPDTATATAEPGKYRSLPDPCGAVDHGTLDRMLPGLKELQGEQRSSAYEGTAAVTYDADRRTGCRWKVESAQATHHLKVDFERVVSYDGTVSDDARAEGVYGSKVKAAELPSPADPREEQEQEREEGQADKGNKGDKEGERKKADEESGEPEPSTSSPSSGKSGTSASGKAEGPAGAGNSGESDAPSEGSADASPSGDAAAGLEPRLLEELGDDAFIDDQLSASASSVRQRTVTVVFRTSNVLVTIDYDEQPSRVGEVPDSQRMQDTVQELAEMLVEKFSDS